MARVERLTLEDVRLLKLWAHKLERLERGEFSVHTEARQHFLQVCRGQAEPQTEIEKAYLKWRATKPDLELLEAELIALATRSERLEEELRLAREARHAAALAEKQERRAAKSARLEEARRERRRQKELARRERK